MLSLVLEWHLPQDGGNKPTRVFRSGVRLRIPFVQRSEADSEEAWRQTLAWELKKSIAIELLLSGKDIIGAVVDHLLDRVFQGGPYTDVPGPFSGPVSKTKPSPGAAEMGPVTIPEPPRVGQFGDHVDAPPESG